MFFVCASVSRTRLVVSWTWYKTCGCSSARHWHMSWVRLLTVSNSWLISLLLLLLLMMMMWRCINFCYRNILTDETLKLWLHSTITNLITGPITLRPGLFFRPRNWWSRATRSIQVSCRSTRLLTPLSTQLDSGQQRSTWSTF